MSDVYEAYEVQRVKNGIANSEELVTQLQKLLETPPQGDPPHILALRRALSATIVQWEQMERTGEEYRPSIELSDLWFNAASLLRNDYPGLAKACQEKAFGWLNQQDWATAKAQGMKISIADMQSALRQLIGHHEASLEEARALKPERSDVTRFLPSWMLDEKKQKAVAFVGVGIAAVIAGAWAVLVFVVDKGSKAADAGKPGITINNNPTISPQMNQNVTVAAPPPPVPSMKVEVTHDICVGEYENKCPKGKYTDYAYCGTLDDVAVKLCGALYKKVTQQTYAGNKCGYAVIKVVCTATK